MQNRRLGLQVGGLLVLALTLLASILQAGNPATRPDPALLATAYPAAEILHYNVSWLGVPAGRLTFVVSALDQRGELLAIDISARTAGLLGKIYPVQDDFRLVVRGERRLPNHYRVDQRQGERRNLRVTIYDQEKGRVIYRRNQDPAEEYKVSGPVHNEFSAFWVMRVMPLEPAIPVMIPTFADRARHEIQVAVEKIETVNSLLGWRETLLVKPRLTFVGLYEKAGDPQIWLTNDQYRIPLRVRSRIAIGSLTAHLSYYKGPAGEFD